MSHNRQKKALKLLAAGCRSLQQMRETQYYGMLSTQQKLGIKYFDQISKPVLREEAEALEVSFSPLVAKLPFLTHTRPLYGNISIQNGKLFLLEASKIVLQGLRIDIAANSEP